MRIGTKDIAIKGVGALLPGLRSRLDVRSSRHVRARGKLFRCAAMALTFPGLLLSSCMTAPRAAPADVPRSAVDYRLRSYFPHEAFDDRCSYDHPIRPNESLAHYTRLIDGMAGQATDLDCFTLGRPEQPNPAGMTARYYYANAFLLLRQHGTRPPPDLHNFIRSSGLDRVRATGEIYYLLAILTGDRGLIDCSQGLASAAAHSGFLQAAEYWRALEVARDSRPNEPACTDPTLLALMPAAQR